eukprot:TRINITY_DN289_c0_g1_i4.p1 TRINITY_DN289_c0_g1~~TRINITY_DN289_c0_g1_i4.p1  ORF type:complete len:703 (-),score=165.37 TRINITY_DN289_c0_g1_i4:39-2147(-)
MRRRRRLQSLPESFPPARISYVSTLFSQLTHTHAVHLQNNGSQAGADDFLPLFIFVLLQSNLPHLISNISYIGRYADPEDKFGEPFYYYTHLVSACSFIESMQSAPGTDISRSATPTLTSQPITSMGDSTDSLPTLDDSLDSALWIAAKKKEDADTSQTKQVTTLRRGLRYLRQSSLVGPKYSSELNLVSKELRSVQLRCSAAVSCVAESDEHLWFGTMAGKLADYLKDTMEMLCEVTLFPGDPVKDISLVGPTLWCTSEQVDTVILVNTTSRIMTKQSSPNDPSFPRADLVVPVYLKSTLAFVVSRSTSGSLVAVSPPGNWSPLCRLQLPDHAVHCAACVPAEDAAPESGADASAAVLCGTTRGCVLKLLLRFSGGAYSLEFLQRACLPDTSAPVSAVACVGDGAWVVQGSRMYELGSESGDCTPVPLGRLQPSSQFDEAQPVRLQLVGGTSLATCALPGTGCLSCWDTKTRRLLASAYPPQSLTYPHSQHQEYIQRITQEQRPTWQHLQAWHKLTQQPQQRQQLQSRPVVVPPASPSPTPSPGSMSPSSPSPTTSPTTSSPSGSSSASFSPRFSPRSASTPPVWAAPPPPAAVAAGDEPCEYGNYPNDASYEDDDEPSEYDECGSGSGTCSGSGSGSASGSSVSEPADVAAAATAPPLLFAAAKTAELGGGAHIMTLWATSPRYNPPVCHTWRCHFTGAL